MVKPDESNKSLLDDEADRLFKELGGIEDRELAGLSPSGPSESDQPAERLGEEEELLDTRRILLVDVAHLLTSFFMDVQHWHGVEAGKESFNQLARAFTELDAIPGSDRGFHIRFRGSVSGSNTSNKLDYLILFGSILVDAATVQTMTKRLGIHISHLSGRLNKALKVFSDHQIYNLFLEIPSESPSEIERMGTSLSILSRFYQAFKPGSAAAAQSTEEQSSFSLVTNELGEPDPNLTVVSGLNNLSPQKMEEMVQKVDKWLKRSDASDSVNGYASVYNAIFGIRNLQGKLKKPPIEVNNINWLLADNGKPMVSREKAQVARAVVTNYGASPQKAAQVLGSVYGNDFKKIDTQQLGQRLHLTSGLLNSVQRNKTDKRIEKEVFRNVQERYAQVRDEVFNDMTVEKGGIKIRSEGREKVVKKVHTGLLKVITFYKARSAAREKVRSILRAPIDFDIKDYETLARDFKISIEDAKALVALLKRCFDNKGHFLRGTFEKNLPLFARYENKVFEFLWHYLKETPHRNDRVAFLNALQMLIAKMQQPKRAIRVLVKDFYGDPSVVSFSDRNSLMLSNLLLRKYNKELNLDIEITPEEVLQVRDGLDRDVAGAAAEIIDGDQSNFFEKIRTIRKKLVQALDSVGADSKTMPLRYLLSLEREVYIFLSLVEGSSAYSVLQGAVKEYGNPDSEIYLLSGSSNHAKALLQHFKVAIRGLGRLGKSKDLPVLNKIKESEESFARLDRARELGDLVRRVMEWVDVSINNVIKRAES